MPIFTRENRRGPHVPTVKGIVVEDGLSEREQYCSGCIAESEVAAMYENVYDRYHGLPDGDREPMEKQRRIGAEGSVRHEGEEGRDEVYDAE